MFLVLRLRMFVTCFYAVLEPKSGSLSFANAGHDLPYLWHSSECDELRARRMPLGLMPGMSYEEKEIKLDNGQGVLFYTNGLVESHGPKGEMFGFPRLRALVARGREPGVSPPSFRGSAGSRSGSAADASPVGG
jgi:serine phosphatase RsbU (regulator of sigma subunit)